MIKWGRTIAILMLLAIGCAGPGRQVSEQPVTVSSLAGSSIENVIAAFSGQILSLSFVEVPSSGSFVQVDLPAGRTITEQHWQGAGRVIHLAASSSAGIEIGVVPLSGYSGEDIVVECTVADGIRCTAKAPLNQENSVNDLSVTLVDDGLYRLTWTEINTGDYNVDGLVAVSDLARVGQYYGKYVGDGGAPYWVDGNNDGMITLGDITPIGQYYNSSVAGYVVWRNGSSVLSPSGEAITISRPAVSPGSGPPAYSIDLAGEAGDSWYVTPVDQEYPASGEGIQSIAVTASGDAGDLIVLAGIAGPDLLDISEKKAGVFNDGHQLLRIIDPSDIVDNIEIGERLPLLELGRVTVLGPGQARFADLPRGVPLILEVICAPAVSLDDGTVRIADDGTVPDDYLVISAVPFTLPEVAAGPMLLDVQLGIGPRAVDGGGDGYNVDAFITETIDGRVASYTRRLDYSAERVSQLTAADHSFDDEVQLADPDRDGISTKLLEQELDALVFENVFASGLQFKGTLQGPFYESTGIITLLDTIQVAGGHFLEMGNIQIRFSEQTRFGELGVDSSISEPGTINPASLQGGDVLLVKVYVLKDGPAGTLKLWAETVARY